VKTTYENNAYEEKQEATKKPPPKEREGGHPQRKSKCKYQTQIIKKSLRMATRISGKELLLKGRNATDVGIGVKKI